VRRSPVRWFVAAVAVLIVAFVASTLFIEQRVRRVDAEVTNIAVNSLPSVVTLAEARTELRRLELGAGRYIGARLGQQPSDRGKFAQWQAAIDHTLAIYASQPFFPGERELFERLVRDKERLYDAIEQEIDEVDAGSIESARRIIFRSVVPDGDQVDADVAQLIELNTGFAHDAAQRIRAIRRGATIAALALDAATLALGGLLIWLAVRAARLYRRAADERRQIAELRAYELDQFAARVAHDLKGPLSTIALSASIAEQTPERMPVVASRMRRGAAMMGTMIDALLDFARAGRSPTAGASAVGPVLDDVVAALRPMALAASARVVVEPLPPLRRVACPSGALASVASNLVHNALKFIEGARGERRVTVRAIDRGACLRLEIEDTGPGLEPGMESRVFDMYVRGPDARAPGLGLGLATVKRLVESHGGALGVTSRRGEGACFWVELPFAAEPAPATLH
jgi:signal transduction histidine kinase